MRQGVFNQRERAYLLSLDVVDSVTQGRIFYTEQFKRDCMRQYWNGSRPVDIFRQAGLYPELIGYKRIERCVARWKEDVKKRRINLDEYFLDNDADGAEEAAGASASASDAASDADGAIARHTDMAPDIYELKIEQCERRIRILERRIKRINRQLVELSRTSAESSSGSGA